MVNRIKEIMRRSGLSPSQFADKIGINRSLISHILSSRNKPSLDLVYKILEAFPSIDANYLLFGETSSLPKIEPKSNMPVGSKTIENAESNPDNKNELGPHFSMMVEGNNSSSHGEKKPEQIIVLYEDGSFKAFRPS